MENKPKAVPKDVFLHLLSIITLYVSAGALIEILFSFVNILFPDALYARDSWYVESMQNSMRFGVSLLIIVFPAYLITNWVLGKGYAAEPEKKNVRIRKWLIYLTLFLSALVLIGDLVFLVIGGIFLYYLWDVRRHSEPVNPAV